MSLHIGDCDPTACCHTFNRFKDTFVSFAQHVASSSSASISIISIIIISETNETFAHK